MNESGHEITFQLWTRAEDLLVAWRSIGVIPANGRLRNRIDQDQNTSNAPDVDLLPIMIYAAFVPNDLPDRFYDSMQTFWSTSPNASKTRLYLPLLDIVQVEISVKNRIHDFHEKQQSIRESNERRKVDQAKLAEEERLVAQKIKEEEQRRKHQEVQEKLHAEIRNYVGALEQVKVEREDLLCKNDGLERNVEFEAKARAVAEALAQQHADAIGKTGVQLKAERAVAQKWKRIALGVIFGLGTPVSIALVGYCIWRCCRRGAAPETDASGVLLRDRGSMGHVPATLLHENLANGDTVVEDTFHGDTVVEDTFQMQTSIPFTTEYVLDEVGF